MATSKEIREGIKRILRDTVGDDDVITGEIFEYLHSQGVVLKVDRELPRVERYVGEDWSQVEAESYFEAREDLIKAGYVAWKSLREEDR